MTGFNSETRRFPFLSLQGAAWGLIVLAYLVFFFTELRLDYNQLLVPCEGAACNWAAITEAEFAVLEDWGLPARFYADVLIGGMILTAVFFSSLGVLIFWREGATRIGFFVSLLLIVMPIASYVDADNIAASFPNLALVAILLSVIGTFLQFLMIYLFPNGRFYPRWSPVALFVTFIYVTLSLVSFGNFIDLGPLQRYTENFVAFFVLVVIAVVFQILRYFRVATLTERLQTRWVLFGFLFYFIGPFLWYFFYGGGLVFEAGAPRLIASIGGWVLIQVGSLIFLSSVTVAILRFRLWNIDLIIRRTLVYGSLTALLALMYFGAVITLQGLFGRLAGEANSPLVTVVSTLLIAALFNPLRIRLQDFIDRRFYRRKYNAEQSVARFAASARDEVDMNRLAGALLATVEETVQPESTSLWINH